MKSEVIHEVYAYWPGTGFHTLWLCKTKEVAEYLLAMESAYEYNYYLDNKELFGGISWERYKIECSCEFKLKEVEVICE